VAEHDPGTERKTTAALPKSATPREIWWEVKIARWFGAIEFM